MKQMKMIMFFFSLILIAYTSYSQEDPRAKEVLEEVSDKINSYDAYIVEFTFVFEDIKTGDKNEEDGTIIVSGEKYKIIMSETEIYYDGETIWSYMKSINEVNVMDAPEESNVSLNLTNPRHLFMLYDRDFKYNYVKEITLDGKQYHKIDLYPNNLDASYSRIREVVDKLKKLFYMIKVFAKDGMHYTFIIHEVKSYMDVSPGTFQFDKEKHPDVDVIDMR